MTSNFNRAIGGRAEESRDYEWWCPTCQQVIDPRYVALQSHQLKKTQDVNAHNTIEDSRLAVVVTHQVLRRVKPHAS